MPKTTVTVEQGCYEYTLEIRTEIDKEEQRRINDFCAFANGAFGTDYSEEKSTYNDGEGKS